MRGLLGGCVAAALLGCTRGEGETSTVAPPVATSTVSVTPVDYVRPGEVSEGTERAFGLPLPRGMRVRVRFPDAVYAEGRLPLEPLANYVRERVDAENVETGPVKTVFERARVKGAPGQIVRIEVTSRAGAVELVVRNRTPRPAASGLSEAERWKQSGLTPDGKPLEEAAE